MKKSESKVKIGEKEYLIAFDNRAKFRLSEKQKAINAAGDFAQLCIFLSCMIQGNRRPMPEDIADEITPKQGEAAADIVGALVAPEESEAEDVDPLSEDGQPLESIAE
jgi:hypothetical protein